MMVTVRILGHVTLRPSTGARAGFSEGGGAQSNIQPKVIHCVCTATGRGAAAGFARGSYGGTAVCRPGEIVHC